MRAEYSRQIAKRVVGRVRASGQYSRDRLPAAERIAIGGADFGRAFDTALLTGDRGVAGLAEIAYRPSLPTLWDGSEIYSFIDAARVHVLQRGPFLPAIYDLSSVGAGVRIRYAKKASLELELAYALDEPYPGYQGNWRFSVGWK